MGRPPGSRGTTFRFTRAEVTEMEARLRQLDNCNPSRALVHDLALQFCASPDRAGSVVVQPRQVWTWFQNRKYSHNRRRTGGAPDEQHRPLRALPPPLTASCATASGKGRTESGLVEFEAKSGRDGAWYDVVNFLALRMFETGDPEVRLRFSGFGAEEDEWINVRKCVRQRSLPCEAAECLAIVPGDLILCFQEGEEQALYFDAHVIDAERRRHDSRGCRCRFLVCFDHDQSEEIVPLRKVCRRPETDHRLQTLQASSAAASVDAQTAPKELKCSESP